METTVIGTTTTAAALPEKKGRSLWVDARCACAAILSRSSASSSSSAICFSLFSARSASPSRISRSHRQYDCLPSTVRRPLVRHRSLRPRRTFGRAAHGTVTSLMVGAFGALLAVLIGTIFGAVAGYWFGRRFDRGSTRRWIRFRTFCSSFHSRL